MPRVDQEVLETFMRITDVTAPVAVQKLKEHSGDLNATVNAHFAEGDRRTSCLEQILYHFSLRVSIINSFSLLDPQFHRSLFDGTSGFTNRAPYVSEPREVRQIPIEVKGGSGDTSTGFGHTPVIEDVTGTEHAVGPDVHGIVIFSSPHINSRPSAPEFDNLSDYGNDVEEQMIRAAIEASKREAQEISDSGTQGTLSHLKDAKIAHAVSLSLKTAEHEKGLRKWIGEAEVSEVGHIKLAEMELGKVSLPNGRLETGSSSIQDEVDDVEEQPLLRNRSGVQGSLELTKDVEVVKNSSASSPIHNANMLGFFMNKLKWGGISSKEHDEAVMLKAAMFGRIPEGTRTSYHFHFPSHLFMQPVVPYAGHVPHPPSPSLQTQRLIQKEIKALEEAEARRLQEEVARKTALEEETRKEEEFRRRLEEELKKTASLPHEPTSDDENAVTLLVPMPDGIQRGQRFLKSDNLQSLFNLTDIGRLVRPYPRCAFSDGESGLTLKELGLTSKQEALFLELM
ncbi:hypothetical protein K2173_018231 [Erythroxylum novogranatense]|uniref:UBX domain-containing protein n=1 Tax=Erythroxylum novogranatense TaxID=1862640 RepID=A0AAV8TPA2_9ROSI|nr:hypothetical protein K2173_018231 [Erythroxylum novogranatense]